MRLDSDAAGPGPQHTMFSRSLCLAALDRYLGALIRRALPLRQRLRIKLLVAACRAGFLFRGQRAKEALLKKAAKLKSASAVLILRLQPYFL
jgi:hypothetical protein